MFETHRSPEAMARCLISYIPCDERVREEVYTTWGRKICVAAIREMREVKARSEDLMRRDHYSKFDERGWDWRGDRHEEAMARTSAYFVEALVREQRA